MTRPVQTRLRALPCLLAAALCAAPATASAQASETCVLLPRAEGAAVPAGTWDDAASALTASLRTRDLIVMPARDAQLRMMGQPMEHCAAIDCAPDVNRFLGTSMAVILEVMWVRGRATAVNVALVGLDADRSVGGQAIVERADGLDDAIRSALDSAWDRWEADQQGQLTVTTLPEGAFVELDGASLGRAPIRRLVPAGIHTLRVTLEGYETTSRDITIDRHETRDVAIELAAIGGDGEGGGEEPAPPPRTEERAHWANWLIGGALLGATAGLLVRPLDALAREGQNVAGPGEPPRYVTFDAPIDGTLLGLAAATLAAGVTIFVLAPIRETVTIEASATSVRARLIF